MRKILLFFGLFCVINLMCAQSPVTHRSGHDGLAGPSRSVSISATDVQFWVGTGSNSTLVCIGWDAESAPYTPTVVVWGMRWNGSITLLDALDSIVAHDSRFTYTSSGSYLQTLDYNDPDAGVHLSPYQEWNCNSYNGVYGSTTLTSTWLRISESTCNDYNFSTVNNLIYASDPNAAFSCLKAQSVSVTDITANTATVNITDTSDLNNYTVKLFEGDSLIDSVVIYTQTIPYTTLTANTGYTVKVFSNCSDGTQTSARSASFRTPCVEVAHTELPWTEDFQSYTGSSYATTAAFFSNHVFCWDLINPYNTSDPYINSSSSVNVSGGKCLYVSSRPVSPTILVLPPFEDTPDQLRLQFDVLSSYGHGFEAGVITDVTDETSFTPIATCLPIGSGWNHFEISFAGITSGRIALRSNDNGPAYLDNVTVDELPSCVKPSQVIVSNIETYSADLSITDPNNTNHYMIYAAGDSVEIYGDSYTLTNLLPNTRYVVGVRTICNDNTFTNATETSFRTDCGPIAIPYHEDFSQFVDVFNSGNAVTDSTLPCWGFFKARDLDRLELLPYTSSYSYGDDGYTLRIYSNYSNSIDILRLPELVQATNTLEVSFMARPSETGTFGGILEVGYMTDLTDTTTFVAVASYPCGQFTNGYGLCAATFSNAPTDAYIALRTVPTGGSAKSWYIDDLDVHDMPACARANGISVDNITTDGFTLHVDDPTTVNHYRYYLTSEDGVDSTDFYDTVVVVTDLAASTDFELSVVSICNDGTLTLPHTISVSTLCAPVTALPFVENFENWIASPSQGMNRCWNRLYCNSSNNLVTNNYPYCATGSANAYNGFKSLKMYSKGSSNGIKEYSVAYLPEFSANVNTMKVRFFYKGGSSYNINRVRLAVGVSEDVTDTSTFTRLATFIPTGTDWTEYEVELNGYTGTGNRITIMQTSTSTTGFSCYIDSLVVETVGSCNRPATFEVSNITANDATLTWTDPSEAGFYILRWTDGANTDSVTVSNETTYDLTGLTPSTTYTADIRSICDGEPTNARTLTFTTSCAPMPLPWSMDFDNITSNSQLFPCWAMYKGIFDDSTNTALLTSATSGWSRATTAFDGSSHMKVNLYGTTCKNWLVTPEIDLTENAELTFDYMLTKYNNTNAPETGAGFEDDRFIVLATTDNGTSWTPLAKWGNDTVNRDDYHLGAVTNTVSNITLSLAEFTGQIVRLAFYGESTVSGTDNDFRIDNIVVALATDTIITPPDTTPIVPVPEEATIAFSDILYWVGEGSNEAVLAVNWADTALAWGYRWNGTATVADMMADIAAADPRFSYTANYFLDDINYIDTAAGMTTPLGISPGSYWGSTNNGTMDAGMVQTLNNGDLEKWADSSTGILIDSVWMDDWGGYWNYIYVYPMTIYPVSVPDTNTTPTPPPGPVDATIAAEDILYWVGTGNTEVIFMGNWCDPDVALAWGVRFDGSSATVEAVMDTLMTYDYRFGYSGAGSIIYDVTYQDTNYNFVMSEPYTGYIMYNVNGTLADFGYTDMYVSQGDLIKVGNTDCATMIGDPSDWTSLGYAWETPILPVTPLTVPDTTPTPPPTPVDASLPFSDILYWVGSGSDSVEFIINFAQPDTAFAWGFLFNGSTTAQDMVDAIAAADPRFWSEGSPSAGGDLHFVLSNGDTLGLSPVDPTVGYNFWWTNLNGVSAGAGAASTLHNGDIFKYGDLNSAIGWDFQYGFYMQEAWVKTPTAVAPPAAPIPVPEEATIEFSEILYWVGEGSNQAVMAVNWADTALAWGYKWNGTATVADMMADIAAADPRFSYELGDWGIDDILFAVAEGDTLRKVPYSYWESKNNGVMDAGMNQPLVNGDFEKWAEPAAGVIVDSMEYGGYWYYSYVYPMTINPVSVPDTVHDGIDNREISRVHAYPNPCTSTLYITNENAERIELYNANGKLLEAIENRDTQVILNMQKYPAGLYLLKVGNGMQKILKK